MNPLATLSDCAPAREPLAVKGYVCETDETHLLQRRALTLSWPIGPWAPR
jgi:hypothetical protein